MSSLKHIFTAHANGTIPVHRYKSELTGMNVVIGEVEGPLVAGDILLGNIHNDIQFFSLFVCALSIFVENFFFVSIVGNVQRRKRTTMTVCRTLWSI